MDFYFQIALKIFRFSASVANKFNKKMRKALIIHNRFLTYFSTNVSWLKYLLNTRKYK